MKQLAAEAEAARAAADTTQALISWREALELLPPGTRQHEQVAATIDALSREIEQGGTTATAKADGQGKSRLAKGTAGIGALGVLLAKFKFVIVFLLTKAKLLLLGFTKAGTLLSMLLAFSVYWTIWGWRFALGFVVSIYVHEMGHVAALSRLGIKATPPMFIPGVGAIVRLKQYPINPREDARVGLAGPIWGLGAALVAFAAFLTTGSQLWGAIAKVGAWINLFNLTPVWQLDGARGFHALARNQRWIAVVVIAGAWFLTREGLLVLLLLTAAFAAWHGNADAEGDPRALIEYGGLVATLSALTTIPVQTS